MDTEYLLIAGIAFIAGFVQGLSGFGSALVAMPLLLQFLPARIATPFCILMGLVITILLSIDLRHHLHWKKIGPIFIGCLPGILLGTYLLKTINNESIKNILGIILIGYGSFKLFEAKRQYKHKNINPAWGIIAGFLTGTIGAAFSAGGPPTIIYTSLTGWTKEEIKATLSGFFLLTGILIATAHLLSGITTIQVFKFFLAGLLPVVFGTLSGNRLYRKMTHSNYLKTIYILLIFMGIMLMT